MIRIFATFFFPVCVLGTSALTCHSANIVWVNEDRGGGGGDVGVGFGGLDWADDQWRALMEDNGHTIIAHGDPYFLDIDLEPERLDLLNSADLVIVSRDSNSGEYINSEEEIQAWTEGITVPMMLMTPFHMRNSRWRMVDTASQAIALEAMEVLEPNHPLFDGVVLDASGEVEIWDEDVLGADANINVTDTLEVGNGQVLAVESGTDFPWIILWEAGVEFYDGSDTFAGNTRLFFGAGSDEDPISWGEKNTTPAGDQIFLNAIDFLTGGGGVTGDFNGNGELDAADLDLLAQAQKDNDLSFDLNGDGMTDVVDRTIWISDLKGTWGAIQILTANSIAATSWLYSKPASLKPARLLGGPRVIGTATGSLAAVTLSPLSKTVASN